MRFRNYVNLLIMTIDCTARKILQIGLIWNWEVTFYGRPEFDR
jgi:hypothetical protein